MQLSRIGLFAKQLYLHNALPSHIRYLNTTAAKSLDQRWRENRGLPANPNAHGVLTDGPDYTYLDGRPTPYGVRQKLRLEKQKQVAERIIQLTQEVDFAVARHKQLKIDEEQRRQEIINNKLKAKGVALLKEQRKKTDVI